MVCKSLLRNGRVPEPDWEGRGVQGAAPSHPSGRGESGDAPSARCTHEPLPHRGAGSCNLAAEPPLAREAALLLGKPEHFMVEKSGSKLLHLESRHVAALTGQGFLYQQGPWGGVGWGGVGLTRSPGVSPPKGPGET